MDFIRLIQYPVWELDVFGGGFFIALIATLHVYIAHFAVGGGFFLVMTEMKGYQESSPEIIAYVKRHSWFFLLLTMVFGGVSGVGIWLVISVLSPAATSLLIHQFVFAWATEWVFFLGEILALVIYVYTFDTMEKRRHLTVGWIYAIFAWLSLFVINGIVAFMLTPGKWLETQNFWHGFFNPTFIPALAFRTSLSLMLAGIFGWVTCMYGKDEELRHRLSRYCSYWLLIPFVFVMGTAYLYVNFLPEPQRLMILSKSPETGPFIRLFLGMGLMMAIAGFMMAVKINLKLRRIICVLMLAAGFLFVGAFEWVREAGRRPYIIYGHLYANSAPVEAVPKIMEHGILKTARWVQHRELTPENRLEAGKEIFRMLCISCHSVGGLFNDIRPLAATYNTFGMDAMLSGMGKADDYMPIFMGTPDERLALAEYITAELGGWTDPPDIALPIIEPAFAAEDFEPESAEYVLLAWTGLGMYRLSDADAWFSFAPPGADIYAHLIRRDQFPEAIREGVIIEYELEPAFRQPADFIEFWRFAPSLTGSAINPNTGQGHTTDRRAQTAGSMQLNSQKQIYEALDLPVAPYTASPDTGTTLFQPYPLVRITAKNASNNTVLASTVLPVPVSTEMNCRACHGGDWRVSGAAGLSDDTARHILKIHDKRNQTQLLKSAGQGRPVSCKQCHDGRPESPNMSLSASIHGFHALFLSDRGADACMACHPESPTTKTAGYRGIHQEIGITCNGCHGTMEDHALSLLTGELKSGNRTASRWIRHLRPKAVSAATDIQPRKPWINLPDCLNCHVDFSPPDTDQHDFNHWTASANDLFRNRSDEVGIPCAACHGSPHAIFPESMEAFPNRDNLIPRQYQQNPYPLGANHNCRLCHTEDMDDPIHHPNIKAMFRNTR